MKYAKVINNEIISIGECPRCTETVSNFYLLSDDEKRAHNYYPVEEVISDVNQTTFIPTDNQVLAKIKLETVIETNESKILRLNKLATDYIISQYPEYKQINASLGIYGDTFKEDMVKFIQNVRTQVATYKASILNNEEIEIIFKGVLEEETNPEEIELVPSGVPQERLDEGV
jgi:hypothetical protein